MAAEDETARAGFDRRDGLVVLIVDDEQSVREVVTMQLRERDFDVLAVADLSVRRIRRDYRIKGLSLERIEREENVSPRHLSKTFQREMKCSVITYIHRCRTDAALYLLMNTDIAVKAIADECGYHSSSELHRHVHRRTGQSPMAFRLASRSA